MPEDSGSVERANAPNEGECDESDVATRVLPAYYGDNYVSLLPGETREIDSTASAVKSGLTLCLRGWNVTEKVVKMGGEK